MCVKALHVHMPQRPRRKNAARKLQCSCEALFAVKFVDSWPSDHPGEGDLRAKRRHHDGVAIFKPLNAGPHSMQQQIVYVNLLNQLVAAVMPKSAQRAARGRSTSFYQRIERR